MRAVAIGSRAEQGSSISTTSGSTAIGPGDAEPLLLPTGEAHGRLLEAVLHLVPERGLAEGLLDDVVEVVLHARQPGAEGDVVVDRLRERVRLLEHHADALAHLDRVDAGVVEIDAVVHDLAVDPSRLDEVVHPVEAAQHGGLATAGRADERGDLVLVDLEVDVPDGLEVAVEDVEVLHVEHDLGRGGGVGLDGGRLGGGGGVVVSNDIAGSSGSWDGSAFTRGRLRGSGVVASGDPGRDHPGEDREEEDDGDQGERRAPRPVLGGGEGWSGRS